MTTQLFRNKNRNWNATMNNDMATLVEGSTPESAVRKLGVKYPEAVDQEVVFVMNNAKRTYSRVDYNICPICNKPIVWARAMKGNKFLIQAYHPEDIIPENAVYGTVIQNATKKRILGNLHKATATATDSVDATSESDVVITQEPEVEPDVVDQKLVVKEKITKLAEAVKEAKIPPISVSIDGMKHNRFAIIGQIARGLKESGLHDNKVSEIRSTLMANGKSFNDLVSVSAEYVTLTEGGMPVHLESGI